MTKIESKFLQDLRLLSIATHGIYTSECDDGHEGVGVQIGNHLARHENSAEGHSLESHVRIDQGQHVLHEAVEVPQQPSPFSSIEDEEDFFHGLEMIINADIVPEGYGALVGEIDGDDTEMIETVWIGCRRTKSFTVSLEHPIWAARIKLWAQAVELFTVFWASGRVA